MTVLTPKGNLVTLVGFDPDGNIIPLQVDSDGYLLSKLESASAEAGSMLIPKGNLVSPVAFDPNGLIIPLQVTADGFLRINVAEVSAEIVPTYKKAMMRLGTVQSIPTGAIRKVLLDTKVSGDDDMIDIANNKIVIKKAATYDIIGQVYLGSATMTRCISALFVNGVQNVSVEGNASAGGYGVQHAHSKLALAVDDYVELYVFQNSAGALNLTVVAENIYNYLIVSEAP